MAGDIPAESHELTTIRRLLLATLLFTMSGVVVELVLLEHYDDRIQWVPFVVLTLGILMSAAALLRASRPVLLAFRAVMALMLLAATAGLYFHYRGNVAFELEMTPTLRGGELFWKSITGATPALAPGTLALFGLVGLIAAYRHPALRRPGA